MAGADSTRYDYAYVGVPDDCPLTTRQLRIVRLAARGHTYGQIAAHMQINAGTVRTHVHDAARRCDLKPSPPARVHWLVMLASRRGWLEHDADAAGYRGRDYLPMGSPRRARWRPTPAERLYLDAFDELLRTRGETAARDAALYVQLMWHVRRKRPAQSTGRDLDAMFRKVGASICTPEQRRLLRYF